MSHLLVGLLLLVWILCPLFYPAAKTKKSTSHLQHQLTSNTVLTKPCSHSPLSIATAKPFQIPQNLISLFSSFGLTSLRAPFHSFTDQPPVYRSYEHYFLPDQARLALNLPSGMNFLWSSFFYLAFIHFLRILFRPLP